MPEKVAVLSKIRLLLFISPKFTTCRHPRAICRKDTAVRIEADGYFLWLEKWIMLCYFVMSSEKKIPHKIPTMWSMFFICKLFNNCKMQKIRRLSKCVHWVYLPPPVTYSTVCKDGFLCSNYLFYNNFSTLQKNGGRIGFAPQISHTVETSFATTSPEYCLGMMQ